MYIDYLSKSRTNGMKTGREYLTAEELATVERQELQSSRLEKVRDLYLFSCYTGLTYRDIKNLQDYHVIRAKDGTRWLSIFRPTEKHSCQIPPWNRSLCRTNNNGAFECHCLLSVLTRCSPLPQMQKRTRVYL